MFEHGPAQFVEVMRAAYDLLAANPDVAYRAIEVDKRVRDRYLLERSADTAFALEMLVSEGAVEKEKVSGVHFYLFRHPMDDQAWARFAN